MRCSVDASDGGALGVPRLRCDPWGRGRGGAPAVMAHSPDFLVVIPAYNEGSRLGRFLGELLPALAGADFRAEVVVVDDGSLQGESEVMRGAVDELRDLHHFLRPVVRLDANRGKGGAVYAAWRGEGAAAWLAFVDADGAVPPREVVRLMRMARDSGDRSLCVMAARIKMLGHEVSRHLHRHLIGRVFATMVHLLTGTGAYDTQCGFKIVPRDIFQQVSPLLVETRYCFDVELICRLERAGARIVEVPIDWIDRPGSKVRLVHDSVDMALALLRIRKRLIGAGPRRAG